MIADCQEITVKAVRFPDQRGTVLYACSPSNPEAIADRRARRMADKVHLVSILQEHLAGMEGSPWMGCHFSKRADLPIQVVHNSLGRPQLLLGEYEGPAVSFSQAGGRIWASLCGDASDIGIDAAGTDEFPKEYPFQSGLPCPRASTGLEADKRRFEKASALLWSIKEAAVKALGCAFHLVDPRHICVYPSAVEKDGWHVFTVCLSGKALVRFPMMASRCIWVRSLFQEKLWLSIALLNWRLIWTETMLPGQA